jgi:branched-chain amino acid aminotransferase
VVMSGFPPLTGTLLPGITRDSLLRLAPDLGVTARQERISIEQWQAQCASGDLTEVFACGTAAVITPVGRVRGKSAEWLIGDGTTGPVTARQGESEEWVIADGEPGPVTMRLRRELIGIQYGRNPDPFGWVHKVC